MYSLKIPKQGMKIEILRTQQSHKSQDTSAELHVQEKVLKENTLI